MFGWHTIWVMGISMQLVPHCCHTSPWGWQTLLTQDTSAPR